MQAEPVINLASARDKGGQLIRLTTWRENRRLALKRRAAKRFIRSKASELGNR